MSIVCNLTTLPSRFRHVQRVIDSLRGLHLFDDIVLHIPQTYKRFPEAYTLPYFQNCTVNIVDTDYGPGTRIMYGQGDTVVWCDDDTEYPEESVKTLLARFKEHGDCVCGSGFSFSKYFIKDFSKSYGERVQVPEGYGMVIMSRDKLNTVRPELKRLFEYTMNDDMALGNVLAKYNVSIRVYPWNIRQFEYGFDKDALHFNNGEKSHLENNKRILKAFRENGCMWFKPHISYAITVCDEYRELDTLLWSLCDGIIHSDEIVILVDSNKTNALVKAVLGKFSSWVKVYERAFTGHFADHKNHLNRVCSGLHIFNLDADEVPSFLILENMYAIAASAELVYVPRVNLLPGASPEFLQRLSFVTTEEGFINWPDYQGRIYKNGLSWGGDIHEKIQGARTVGQLPPSAKAAIWHIKSVERMQKQNDYYTQRQTQKPVPASAVKT